MGEIKNMTLIKRFFIIGLIVFPSCLCAMKKAKENILDEPELNSPKKSLQTFEEDPEELGDDKVMDNTSPSPRAAGFIRPKIPCFSNELPNVQPNIIRFVSYNILASFFTDRLESSEAKAFSMFEAHTTWAERREPFIDLLEKVNPSICNLQEVSYEQFRDILEGLDRRGKCYAAIGHVPYTHKKLSDGFDSSEYTGFNVITLYDTINWTLEKNGTFWLKEDADISPSMDMDKKEHPIDTGFGNDDYRNVEWSVLAAKPERGLPKELKLLILGSHFSLLASRPKCAELIINRLQKLIKTELTNVENLLVMVSGDFNLFSNREGSEAYSVLTSVLKDHRDAGEHFGFAATFIGTKKDKFCSMIDNTGNIDPNSLDFMGFNQQANLVRSFSLAGEFNLSTGKLIEPLIAPMRTDRNTISDHCLIGADIKVAE